eukprot:3413037-Prymnesium_polylepis.1
MAVRMYATMPHETPADSTRLSSSSRVDGAMKAAKMLATRRADRRAQQEHGRRQIEEAHEYVAADRPDRVWRQLGAVLTRGGNVCLAAADALVANGLRPDAIRARRALAADEAVGHKPAHEAVDRGARLVRVVDLIVVAQVVGLRVRDA